MSQVPPVFATFPGENGKIAFGFDEDIWVMNADGTEQTNLTDSQPFDREPDWSPDGKKIAFTSNLEGHHEIFSMNADGTEITRLTHNPSGSDDPRVQSVDPDWSPDGTKIVFTNRNYPDSPNEITVMNADGTGQNVIANIHGGSSPDWGTAAQDDENTSELTVQTVDLDNEPLSGMWTVIRSTDGTILETGFSPLTFTGTSGTDYKVSVANYDGKVFHWEDDSINSSRTIMLSEDATITATYDTGDTLRGFTLLTYTGTADQPDLTVTAVSLDEGETLHMWTLIDPQSSDKSETTYKVYASNYETLIFDHWEDGSTDRVRTLTTEENMTITAYYQIE